MSKYGGSSNNCVRCEKAVYFVEQQSGPGGMYHKACFSCKECNKRLDSTNLADKENQIYCKTCYGRLFGPKGSSVLNQGMVMETRFLQRQTSPLLPYPKQFQNQAKISSNLQNRCTRKSKRLICNNMLEPTRALVA
jgi:cysteine/glycine-rich protein